MHDQSKRHLLILAQLAVQALILYSIVTVALETMPELQQYHSFFRASEIVVVLIFSAEYIVRWALSPNRRTYPFQPLALIDFLAIFPFYLKMGVDLRAVRGLRMLRIFRILKLGRYSRAVRTLGVALRRAGPELAVTAFMALILVVIAAMAMYYAENAAQPEVYSSIPASLWWSVVTLTTVGYGDAYPVTPLGKIFASFVMFLGIGLIAIPTSIMAGSFSDTMREQRELGSSS